MTNSVVLLGRLVRDVDLKTTSTGLDVATFTLAVDRGLSKDKKQEFKAQNKPTADFIRCIAYQGRAKTINNFVAKGDRLLVEGRIQTGSYLGAEGKKVYTTDVVVTGFSFIDFTRQESRESEEQVEFFGDSFEAIDDDRIPF